MSERPSQHASGSTPEPTSSRSIAEVIGRSESLRGLGEREHSVLAAMAVWQRYDADESVFVQNSPCPGLFLIDTGLVRVFRSGPAGQEFVMHLCGPGQSFAEVAAFGNFPLPASATAIQPTRCVLIPIEALQRELAANHELCRQMLTSMAYWVRHFVRRFDDLVLRDATQRIARLLCDVPCDRSGRLRLPGPKKDLANHLNLTSETFSRVLRRLHEEGVLDVDSDRSIRVIDPEQLTRLSGPVPESV